MLRKFKISVDGTHYLVEMEEVGAPIPTAADAAAATAPAAPAPQAPAPAPAPAPAAPPQPAAAASDPTPAPSTASSPAAAPSGTSSAPAGAHVQAAPMPGKIIDVLAKPGDAVEVNQCVVVLEAMKMESQIVAEQAGTIASIAVAPGDMVNPGDELFSIA